MDDTLAHPGIMGISSVRNEVRTLRRGETSGLQNPSCRCRGPSGRLAWTPPIFGQLLGRASCCCNAGSPLSEKGEQVAGCQNCRGKLGTTGVGFSSVAEKKYNQSVGHGLRELSSLHPSLTTLLSVFCSLCHSIPLQCFLPFSLLPPAFSPSCSAAPPLSTLVDLASAIETSHRFIRAFSCVCLSMQLGSMGSNGLVCRTPKCKRNIVAAGQQLRNPLNSYQQSRLDTH